MNSVALIGRLTANPTTHAGERHESATFRLDKLAATCGEYLTTGPGGGRRLTPLKPKVSAGTPGSGRLHLNEWTSREGERRSKIQVVADAVQFLDPPKKAADPDGGVADPDEKPAVGAYQRRKAS